MHQLADPEVVPQEHAVRFQKDDRQQCSITMQAPVESLRFTMWFAILKWECGEDKPDVPYINDKDVEAHSKTSSVQTEREKILKEDKSTYPHPPSNNHWGLKNLFERQEERMTDSWNRGLLVETAIRRRRRKKGRRPK
jgi:hypothetical protein